ncbi:MAG: hypothetical protein KC613_00050, partial [Myxococcales bacterium]|nr:hypothetical protein [Myxococcales bacterium]
MAAPLLPPRAARWPLLLALALLVGCGAAPKPAPLEADDAAAVLAHVPADTPYLLASLADVPPALAEREVARLGQALQVLVDALLEQAAVARAQSPFDRLVLAAAAAVDGKLDGPGLEALGVGRHPRFALYGIAGLPALRARVADGRKIEALVDRVLTDAGVQVERGTLEGQAYRVVFVGDLPLLYLAFGDRWAVAGVLLPPVRDELLPVLLGVTPPKVPLTAAELGPQLAADGLVPSGFGWLKPAGLLTAGWPMTRVLEAGAPAGCVGTLREAFGAVESLHLGSRGADAARTSSVVHLRLAPKLREDLAKSLRPAPGLAPRASGLDKAALAVGLDVPVALAALQGWGRRLQANPSACPWFSGFDRLAEHLTSGAWQRVVDGAPAVQGLAVVLSRLEPAEAGPPRVDAALWIAGPAQALFDLMGDAVPGAQGLAQAPPG